MGVLFDYFAADSDAVASSTIDWPSGPSRGVPKKGPFGKAMPGLPTVDGKGIEPVVTLGMLEELLTGRTFDDQLADPEARPILADRDGGERLVIRIGDKLVEALGQAQPSDLDALAGPWSQIEEFYGSANPADLALFLRSLRDLAVSAKSGDQKLYCWVCV